MAIGRFHRISAVVAAVVTAATGLVACGPSGPDEPNVYYLNFKPEQDAAYQKIAAAYTAKTGIPVKVVTAASGTYEQTLRTEVGKRDRPTLFQVNGPVGMHTWEAYLADLTDADITKALTDDVAPLTNEEGKVLGVPFAVEGYGIIYNADIMAAYAALDNAVIDSVADITDFDTLRRVAEDMQAKKDRLGIDGAFAATSLATGEEWRFQTHLANIPVHYEFADLGTTDLDELAFTYNENFRNLFDLYLNNSTVAPTLTPAKTVTDSMADFALGKAAMVQNGNWAWSQISDVAGNVVKKDKIAFLPMYTGMPADADQGLAIGTENYLAVNAKVSTEDQQASIDFINWLYTSEEGKEFVVNDLGFIAPFTMYSPEDTPDDPLAKQVAQSLADDTKATVPWDFQYFPSQQFKDDFGQSLAQYASGTMDWPEVVEGFQESWEAEKAMIK